jgi:hypothetical protein
MGPPIDEGVAPDPALLAIDLSAINVVVVVVAALAVAAGGLFTIRSNVAKVWRENYEGERAAHDEAEKEILRQRELKHSALNEAAALRMRTDLVPVLESLGKITGLLADHDARMTETHGRLIDVLDGIKNELKALRRSIPPRAV